MPRWVKSARSTAEGDNCVEVALVGPRIRVRNSKRPGGPAVDYTRAEWEAFLEGVRRGEFEWERLRSVGYGLGYASLRDTA